MPPASPSTSPSRTRSSATSAAIRASLYSPQDQLARIAAVDAQFLGYSRDSRDKLAAPVFRYRVGKNSIDVATAHRGQRRRSRSRSAASSPAPQSFALNDDAAAGRGGRAPASSRTDRWTLPAGKLDATLRGRMALSDQRVAARAV